MKKLKPHTVDWAQIERFLASADKKLASARKILAFDEEACLQQVRSPLRSNQRSSFAIPTRLDAASHDSKSQPHALGVAGWRLEVRQ